MYVVVYHKEGLLTISVTGPFTFLPHDEIIEEATEAGGIIMVEWGELE